MLGEHSALLPLDQQLRALRALLSRAVASLTSPNAAEVQASSVLSALRVLSQLPAAAGGGGGGSGGGLGGSTLLLDAGNDAVGGRGVDAPTGDAGGDGAVGVSSSLLEEVRTLLLPFCTSAHPEVVERARCAHAIAALLGGGDADGGGIGGALQLECLAALRTGLGGELRAVAPKAQRKVKPPSGLDLSTPLYTPTLADWAVLGTAGNGGSDTTTGGGGYGGSGGYGGGYGGGNGGCGGSGGGTAGGSGGGGGRGSPSSERVPRQQPSGPYYLPSEPSRTSVGGNSGGLTPGSEDHRLHSADGGGGPATPGAAGLPYDISSRLREVPSSPQPTPPPRPLGGFEEDAVTEAVVDLHEEMPDGAEASDDEEERRKASEAEGSGAGGGPPQTRGGGDGPMLVDLLGGGAERLSPATPQVEGGGAGESKRRRRKHRSADKSSSGGGGGADAASAADVPLVSF